MKKFVQAAAMTVSAILLSQAIATFGGLMWGPAAEKTLLTILLGIFAGMWGSSIHDRARLQTQMAVEIHHRVDAEMALATELANQSVSEMQQALEVEFNAAEMPPNEYLMRRSYNPNDAQFPGSIIREMRCTKCGRLGPKDRFISHLSRQLCTAHDDFPLPEMEVYSVDVPLIKSSGERWT